MTIPLNLASVLSSMEGPTFSKAASKSAGSSLSSSLKMALRAASRNRLSRSAPENDSALSAMSSRCTLSSRGVLLVRCLKNQGIL